MYYFRTARLPSLMAWVAEDSYDWHYYDDQIYDGEVGKTGKWINVCAMELKLEIQSQ